MTRIRRQRDASDTVTEVERRGTLRWRSKGQDPLRVRLGEHTHVCQLRDISAGGAALMLDAQPATGLMAVVEINDTVRLPGCVLRAGNGGVAIQFQLPMPLARQIEQAVRFGFGPAEW